MPTREVKVRGQRSRSQRSRSDLTVSGLTPVWIHIWRWNDAKSLMLLTGVVLLYFKVIHQISRSRDSKTRRVLPKLGGSGMLLQFEFNDGYGMMNKVWSSIKEVSYCFSRSIKFQSHGKKSPILTTRIGRFRIVPPDWIHQWLWNDAHKLTWYRRGVPLFLRSSIEIQGHRGHKINDLTRIGRFQSVTAVWIHQWFWNDAQSLT